MSWVARAGADFLRSLEPVVTATGGEMRIWNARTGKLRHSANVAQPIRQAVFSRDGGLIFTVGAGGFGARGNINIWDTERGLLVMTWTPGDHELTPVGMPSFGTCVPRYAAPRHSKDRPQKLK